MRWSRMVYIVHKMVDYNGPLMLKHGKNLSFDLHKYGKKLSFDLQVKRCLSNIWRISISSGQA